MRHYLKIKAQYFDAIANGKKTFEIRQNTDRNFQELDEVVLVDESGRQIAATIGYVCDYEQKKGYVVFSLLEVAILEAQHE